LDKMPGLSTNDAVIDAFGELATRPFDLIWANTTYSRCNFTPYNGVGSWDVSGFFEVTTSLQYTDLGTPPSSTCN